MGRWRVPKARDGGAGAGARVAGPSTTGLRPAVPLPMTLSRHREDFERAWRASLSAEPLGRWGVPNACYRAGGEGGGGAGRSPPGLRPGVPLPMTLSRHREDFERAWRSSLSAEPMGRWRVPKARDGGAGAGARVAGPSTTGLRPAVPLPVTLSRHREDFERASGLIGCGGAPPPSAARMGPLPVPGRIGNQNGSQY